MGSGLEQAVRSFYATLHDVVEKGSPGTDRRGTAPAPSAPDVAGFSWARPGEALLHPEAVVHVPALGIEVQGGDASLAWLHSDARRQGAARITEIVVRGELVVVFLEPATTEGGASVARDASSAETCHVLRFAEDRLRSCCVIHPVAGPLA